MSLISRDIPVKFRPIKSINRRVRGETVTIFEAGKLYKGVLKTDGKVDAYCKKYGRNYTFNMNFATFEIDKFGQYL